MPPFSVPTPTLRPAASAAPDWTVLPLENGHAAELAACDWIGRQLDTSPAALAIARDDRGRPHLNDLDGGLAGVDFNWSHSGGQLAVALGRGLRVGIDIEREHARPRALALARRFFCAAEAEWLAAQPEPGRSIAFLRLWCGKEAILKAHGHGLSFGLHRLRLADRDGALTLIECDDALGDPALWRLQELNPAPGYLGALAWRPL